MATQSKTKTKPRKASAGSRSAAPVWDRPAPKKVRKRATTHLTAQQKEHAKRRAKRAGRNYPNLVDNIHEATAVQPKRRKSTGSSSTGAGRKRPTRSAATRSSAGRKRSSQTAAKTTRRTHATKRKVAAGRRGSSHAREKDPRGGLTAAGRTAFQRRDGSHLQPGVKKPASTMSLSEMKRKGSWAVRFYGRKGKLPPLRDEQGRPTRFALTAAAWGEPVPKTMAQARAIAAKGRRLLAKAKLHAQRV